MLLLKNCLILQIMIRLILILFFLALSRDLYAQIAIKVGINQASA